VTASAGAGSSAPFDFARTCAYSGGRVFDEVTRRERGTGAARRARFVLASTVVQGLLIAGAVAATAALRASPSDERLVPVTFVPPAPQPAAPAPAAGPSGTPMPAARPARPKPRPRAETEPAPPPPPLVQPRELPEAIPQPPATAPEPEPAPGAGAGVVGGTPGGGGGAPVPGAVGALGPGAVEDAPEDVARRNLSPAQAEPGCVQRRQQQARELKDHPELEGRVVQVEFQVGPTGGLSGFRARDRYVGARVKAAMWSVIQECRWLPGTDAEGRPASRTVSLRFRFTPE
jgi:protein TonB